MTNNLSFVTDPHGKFYAGMTLKEAQSNGTDKSFLHRDFHNLDKNKDGVLSVEEVMNERKRSSKVDKWTAGIFGTLGVLDLFSNRSSKLWYALDLILDTYIVTTSLISAKRIDKGTERIENELKKREETSGLSLNA